MRPSLQRLLVRCCAIAFAALALATCGGGGTTSDNGATSTGTDMTPPTSPSNVVAMPLSQAQISVTWAGATDNMGVTGYRVYRNSAAVPVSTVTATAYTDTGLTTNTVYSYTIVAVDAAGNASTQSAAGSARTLAVADMQPANDTQVPTVPGNARAVAISPQAIDVSWTAASDNVAVTSYRVYRNGGTMPVATVTGTIFTNTGLSAATLYSYTVVAVDAAGNASAPSTAALATTPATSVPSASDCAAPGVAQTALQAGAAGLSPGQWCVLQTNGWNNAGILEPCGDGSNIVEYADSASWDPISRQVLFVGSSHGNCYGSRFVAYRDAENMWRSEPLPPGMPADGRGPPIYFSHAYHHNTINPATGEAFFIEYGRRVVHRYDTNGTRTWTTHSTIPLPRSVASCCRALKYFPEMGGLLYVDGVEGVWFYRNATGQWQQLANTQLIHNSALPQLAMGQYDNVAEHSPMHGVVIFGGGRGSGRVFHKIDKAGVITRMRDAPADVLVGSVYSLNSVDPASGRFLFFDDDRSYHDYNVMTDTWSQIPGTHPLANSGYFEVAEAPITTYGVNFFFDHNSRKVHLYKHLPR